MKSKSEILLAALMAGETVTVKDGRGFPNKIAIKKPGDVINRIINDGNEYLADRYQLVSEVQSQSGTTFRTVHVGLPITLNDFLNMAEEMSDEDLPVLDDNEAQRSAPSMD